MPLDTIGNGLLANDVGSAIKGYRIDVYKGFGRTVCAGFGNPIVVGACTPGSPACPASPIQ